MKRVVAFISLFFTLLVIAGCIISIIFPWYIVTSTSVLNTNDKLKTLYYWDEIRVTNDHLNASNIIYQDSSNSDATTYDDLGFDHIKNVFVVSLAIICVATLLATISAIVTLIAFIGKSRIAAKISGVLMVLVFLLLLASYFQFLGRLQHAFREDDINCSDNAVIDKLSSLFKGDDTYCDRFMGKSEGALLKLSFMPYVGWWFAVGASFFSLITFIPLFKTSK